MGERSWARLTIGGALSRDALAGALETLTGFQLDECLEGARLLGIRLHDHVILGNGTGKWVSLAQRGLL